MIDLGLARVTRLLALLGNPHVTYNAVHVAGTNGKGSTLAYLLAVLCEVRLRCGRFTSPHLLEYNDCVAIDNVAYPRGQFDRVHAAVVAQDRRAEVGCTEFELLTATALKIFQLEQVDWALIEVGVGGRLDSTNVLVPGRPGVVVAGITKVAMDHELLLGNTLAKIAREKAGIVKSGVPVVVDGSNAPEVLLAVRLRAAEVGAPVHVAHAADGRVQSMLRCSPLLGDHQAHNLAVALGVLDVLQAMHMVLLDDDTVRAGLVRTAWPGRLQLLTDKATGVEFLLDGAHNESAAVELAHYLGSQKRGFIFVVGMSKGKDMAGLLKHLVGENDAVVPMPFSTPTNMPWVECYAPSEVAAAAQTLTKEVLPAANAETLFPRLAELRARGDTRRVVVCGSLYLCSDILRTQH